MGSMAEETLRRMREDGLDTSGSAADAVGGLVPGTGGDPPPPQQPPAGESNTDIPAESRGTPESIPYARFKEVNDQLQQLRGYEQLRDYGYDPDSLGRLAAFDARFAEDPTGTLAQVVSALDLPEDRKEQIVQLLSGEGDTPAPSGSGGEQETPDDASRLSLEDQEALDWARQRREREAAEEQRDREDKLTGEVRGHWDVLDKGDGLPQVKERTQLMYISLAARSGGYTNLNELAQKARELYLEDREDTLGSAVRQRGGRAGSPLSVPSSGPPAPETTQFGSLKEANKAAEADILAGRLPGMRRGG